MTSTYKGRLRGGRGMRGVGMRVRQFSAQAHRVEEKPGREGEYLKAAGSTTPEKQARRAAMAAKQAALGAEQQASQTGGGAQ